MNPKIKEQKKRFEDSMFYRTNDFVAYVTAQDGDLDSCTISDFTYNGEEITLTVRDIYQKGIFEEWLDKHIEKHRFFRCRKKKLSVVLSKITSYHMDSVYDIVFDGCYLKNYVSSPYTYGNATIHTYTLVIKYDKKKYVKGNVDVIADKDKIREYVASLPKSNCAWKSGNIDATDSKTSLKIIENSNKMLSEAKKTVKRHYGKTKEGQEHASVVNDNIDKAIGANDAIINKLKKN